MTDIEIAKQVNLENILDIAKKTNIDENDVELYGKYKAKISNFEKYNKNSKGKFCDRFLYRVEMRGFEPLTPCLQGRCSPN